MQCAWIAIVLLACVGFTQALRCYDCLRTDSNCSDPFDKGQRESLLQSCPTGTDTACLKGKGSNGEVVRSCANDPICGSTVGGNNECLERSDVMRTGCCCTGDGCNGATTRHIGYIALVAMLVFGKVVVALF